MNQKYILDVGWLLLLNDLKIAPEDALSKAQLPESMMRDHQLELTALEYYRLWESLVTTSGDSSFPLKVVQTISSEMFNPPIFAALCSLNSFAAIQRLKQYKPLIGPIKLSITEELSNRRNDEKNTVITLTGIPKSEPLPIWISLFELLFIVHLLRMGTRERVIPVKVEVAHDLTSLSSLDDYSEFLGVEMESSDATRLILSESTMQLPFKTVNNGILQAFEPGLAIRLSELGKSASFKQRVRAYLFEAIAGGGVSMHTAASQLAVSTRTMQRRLKSENTSFQKELSNVRKDLALHYLNNTEFNSLEIAFLLGYDDPNSFFRAFSQWTGLTPEAVRKSR
ncbi:AraC family transcriptional regulator ligand-binding domain-containing protein [Endozoicomonas sp. G2_1]|uniref:AraC family transcriptional regulator n=1 Tax=Endozoicomonas sp. G2_1 TaxID=2821091 RepID=UPI001ADC4655|nr:AraC family transcriptional regulator [Endozoicomonas sp. G2_1]MBO9490369.1 AraC family transcriptional regulator ligand-binding domain-containing protein [Endozoicomonas sp. G2_1]